MMFADALAPHRPSATSMPTLQWLKDILLACSSYCTIYIFHYNYETNHLKKITYYLSTVCHQTSGIGRTLVGNKLLDHSDVVETSPVGAAPTTSSCLHSRLNTLFQWVEQRQLQDATIRETLSFWNLCDLYQMFDGINSVCMRQLMAHWL